MHDAEHSLDPVGGRPRRGENPRMARGQHHLPVEGVRSETCACPSTIHARDLTWCGILKKRAALMPRKPKPKTNFKDYQIMEGMLLGPTGARKPIERQHPYTTPAEALATDEQQDAFCQLVVACDTIQEAAKRIGIDENTIWYWKNSHPEFKAKLKIALESIVEKNTFACENLFKRLLSMDPKDMNLCANAYSRVVDYRMRLLAKINRMDYGDHPSNVTNIQNNTGIVCDEETRARLISLNQKLLQAGSETKQIKDVPLP